MTRPLLSRHSSHAHQHNPHVVYSPSAPIKKFYLANGIVDSILALPSQILFALMGMLGLAHYARQIVRVRPSTAGPVALRAGAAEALGLTPVYGAGDAEKTEKAKAAAPNTELVNADQWIVKNTPSLSGVYTPPWWLPNGHLQTFYIVAGNFSKTDKVDYVRTLLRVPDGGTLALDITPPNHEELPADAPTVLVCHGLTGNANESYVRNVLAWVAAPKEDGGLGGRGVVANFRGCGGSPITSTQMYSAAASSDVNTVAHYLRATYPQSSVHGIGFSLGASVMARYLGERGDTSLLSSGCVLACPWNIVDMSHALEDGWFSSRVYSSALGQNLVRLFFRAYEQNPKVFEADDSRVKDIIPIMEKLRAKGSKVRLREVDEVFVTRAGGPIGPWPMKDADEYYAYAGSNQLIHNVKVPLLGINAFDDPVVHGDALPVPEVTASSHVHMAVTGAGGHLGWFDGPLFGKTCCTEEKCHTSRWILRPIAEFLSAAARDLPPRAEVKTVTEDKDGEEWTWVDAPPMIPQTGANPTRIGWRVTQQGVPLEQWMAEMANSQAVQIQGL